jgi:hypothetical protein
VSTALHRADMEYRLDNMARPDFWDLKGGCSEDKGYRVVLLRCAPLLSLYLDSAIFYFEYNTVISGHFLTS